MAVEDVVPQNERDPLVADEVAPDDERLRDPLGARLHRVLDVDPPLVAVLEQTMKQRGVVGGGDDEDLADSREHQRRQRVVDHRLVVDGHELLAHDERRRVQARPGASSQDDSAVHDAFPPGDATSGA